MTEIDAIKAELRRAFADMGATPGVLARLDAADALDPPMLYRSAERLGADRWLLAAIGSFRDTLSDRAVLQELREWNAAKWDVPPRRRR